MKLDLISKEKKYQYYIVYIKKKSNFNEFNLKNIKVILRYITLYNLNINIKNIKLLRNRTKEISVHEIISVISEVPAVFFCL